MPPLKSRSLEATTSYLNGAVGDIPVTYTLPGRRNRVIARGCIFIDRGAWWFFDRKSDRIILLDALLENCGWNVSGLCSALHVSERTFARVVERSLGINPKDWLCRLRAVAACRLLREVGKVEPVACMLGYSQVADFSREFKRQIGVVPSMFLKSERSRMFHVPEAE